MNGAAFCTLLERLGYSPHVSPSSFEWLFYDEESARLLKWLLDNLTASNVLRAGEPQLYDTLQAEGKVLQGDNLEAAYTKISREQDGVLFEAQQSWESIREETKLLKSKAVLLQQRLAALQRQATSISKQSSLLAADYGSRESTALEVLQRVSDAKEGLIRFSSTLDDVLGSLRDTAAELTHFHSGQESEAFVSFADLTAYLVQEEACASALQHELGVHFQENKSGMTPSEDKQGSRLPDTDPTSDRQDAYERRVKELQRLRIISEVSETQLVEALADRDYAKAKLKVLKQQLKEPHPFNGSSVLARQRHGEVQAELLALGKEEEKLRGEVIPKLAAEVARLQDALVLEGDYEVKLARQELQTGQLEQLVDAMLQQRARHLFLEAVCQVEQQQLASARSLLRGLSLDVGAISDSASHRTDCCRRLADATMLRAAGIGGAETGPDPLLDRVKEILPPACSVADLEGRLRALEMEEEEELPRVEASLVAQLQEAAQVLHRMLFTGGEGSRPELTPQVLAAELADAKEGDLALSGAVERLNAGHQSKRQILHRRPSSEVERRVYADFFCAPEKLTNYAEELSEKLATSSAR